MNDRPKANILVVDDTPDNLRLLMGILDKQGYKVRPASADFLMGLFILHRSGADRFFPIVSLLHYIIFVPLLYPSVCCHKLHLV